MDCIDKVREKSGSNVIRFAQLYAVKIPFLFGGARKADICNWL